MQAINQAVTNVNNTILDATALTNFVATMTNLGSVTENLSIMATQAHDMMDSNFPSVHVAMTNLAALAEKLDVMAGEIDRVITTNSGNVTEAVSNLNAASDSLRQLTGGLQAGQGLAGSLLKDEKVRTDFAALLAHLNDMAQEYTRFGQALNENGIWKTLWKPKPSPTNAPGR
jgi:ABC-type transporter Mla subunit MlaD